MRRERKKGWLRKAVEWGWRRLLSGVKDRKLLTKAGGRRTGGGGLGAGVCFRLHSGGAMAEVATSSASEITAKAQTRFREGELFAPLRSCAEQGALVAARLVEHPGGRQHLVAVFPSHLADRFPRASGCGRLTVSSQQRRFFLWL